MNQATQNRWRNFLMAFTLTLVLLSAIMIATVMAVQPSMPQQQHNQAAEPYSFRPQAADTLTLAVIGTDGDTATDFLLIRFNPQYGQVPLTLLPPDALVRLDGASVTLADAYQKGGGRRVKATIAERFGIVVDRYAVLARDPFVRIADKVGSVVFELPADIVYQKDGYAINLAAGVRRLDGKDVADVFACPSLADDPVGKSNLCGNLVAATVNQNLDAAGEGVSSAVFALAVNLLDTDVSSADYEYRRKSADFVSQLDATVSGSLPVQGSYLADGVSFELAESYVELVRQYFQTVA